MKYIVERVNVDFEGEQEKVLGFCKEENQGKKRNIASLRNEAEGSVTSTKGKLEVFQKHYEHLGKVSVDNDFDNWKEAVQSKESMCSSLSEVWENEA